MFHIGEKVVHPRRGVGEVSKLEEREFEPGVMRRYYEIAIPGGSTVWVPADMPDSGLRRVAGKNDIARCREILISSPAPLTDDKRERQSELVEHLKLGTIEAQCEVVRDLSGHFGNKLSSGGISNLLEAVQAVLCQEWALVEGISIHEAGTEIHNLLTKGREVPVEAE